MRTEDLLLVQVVHRDRDSQHGGQGNQVLADVAVHKRAVVGAPVGHDGVNVGEGALAGELGSKPGGGPSGVGSHIQHEIQFSSVF